MKARMMIVFLSVSTLLYGQSLDALYQNHCAHCHGVRYQGGNAKSLVDGVWAFGSEASAIRENIAKGILDHGMPAYGEVLTDEQIDEMVTFFMQGKQAAIPASPFPERLQTTDYELKVEVVAQGLEVPWDLAFLNEQYALVTERPGRLRVLENGLLKQEAVAGTPAVVAEGQGGLLAVAFDPDYGEPENGWIYLAYSHGLDQARGRRAPAMTRVVRGRIRENRWTDEQVLFEAPHGSYRTTRQHYGTRIVFDAQRNLYFSIGDRGSQNDAQDLSRPNGKIHRIRRDGTIPADNPFVGRRGVMPTIYAYGNRNPQGLSFHPKTGDLWEAEHGPLGGDELNRIESGGNYGWPVISYGKNYDGTPVTELTHQTGMEQPVYYWTPSTALCDIDFVRGPLFSKWHGGLLAGSLKYEDVRLLTLENGRVVNEEIILKKLGRVRAVELGPEGAIYVVLNDPGAILRLTPLTP
jgi:aldose sugar dehydrogenase